MSFLKPENPTFFSSKSGYRRNSRCLMEVKRGVPPAWRSVRIISSIAEMIAAKSCLPAGALCRTGPRTPPAGAGAGSGGTRASLADTGSAWTTVSMS